MLQSAPLCARSSEERATDFESVGRGFESLRARFNRTAGCKSGLRLFIGGYECELLRGFDFGGRGISTGVRAL